MEITIQRNKLARALNYIARSVSTKPNIPVLSNVLLEVEKGVLKLSGTNLDMGLSIWVAGQMTSEGKTTVSARYISDFISASSSEKVKIRLDDDKSLDVSSEKANAKFQTIGADEFPILPMVKDDAVFTLESSSIVQALQKVIFACSTDNTPGRLQQTGVYMKAVNEGKTLKLVGLDGYRLSVKDIKMKTAIKDSFEVIVPAKALTELVKMLQSESEIESIEVHLNSSKSQILFKFEEIVLSIRLLEGPYPEYTKALPDSFNHQFELDRLELIQSIKIVNTFARSLLGNRADVDVNPDEGSMILRSSIVDLGRNEATLTVYSPTGGKLETAYNLRYLAELAEALDTERIVVESLGSLSAAVFKDPSDADYLHLIMPLKRD